MASIELPTRGPALRIRVSTVCGKNLPSTSGTSEAGQKLPIKDKLDPSNLVYPCRINSAHENNIYQGTALAPLLTVLL